MPTTAYLLSSLGTRYPGRSRLRALADSIGATLRCLERVAEKRQGEFPTLQLVWDVYENALQTICGLRQRKGMTIPALPHIPADAPPRVALATVRDWLIQVDLSRTDPTPAPSRSLARHGNDRWIDCRTAAATWQRSMSWWRSKVGDGKPISHCQRNGKTKLFRLVDADRLARRLSIGRRSA